MPLKNVLENITPPTLDNIPMTRDDAINLPSSNHLHRFGKASLIRRGSIPIKPLLPFPMNIQKMGSEFGPNPAGGVYAGLGELLVGGEIKDQVRLDHRSFRLVIEDYFLIHVPIEILHIKHIRQFFRQLQRALILLCVNDIDGNVFVPLRLALLIESLGPNYRCRGVFLLPGS